MSSFYTEMSKLNNEHIVLADEFRIKQAELSVLKADTKTVEQFHNAHSILVKASDSWQAARTAALAGEASTARNEADKARRQTNQARQDLAKVGKDSVPADSAKVPPLAASSPEPKPAPVPTPPSAPKPAPSPKNDPAQPAQAGPAAVADKDSKVVDPEMVSAPHNDKGHARAINEKFEEIDRRLIPEEYIEIFKRYTPQDLERGMKASARVGRMFHRNNPHGKHTNRHDRDHDHEEYHEEHDNEHYEERADEYASAGPHTKVHNFGADQKATPQHERN